jgi:DNA repair protein RadA
LRQDDNPASSPPRRNGIDARAVDPVAKVSTGSTRLDSILGGGVSFGRLTEFSGDSGAGKSQVLFTLVVGFPREKGRLLFVDTAGAFRPERVHQIATLRRREPDAVLSNVDVLGAKSFEKVVADVTAALESGHYSAVLVDSLSDLFYGGTEFSRDTARLSLFCRELAYSALTRGILVAVANGIRYNPDTDTTSAQGFDYTAAYIHTRIRLSRNGERWLAVELDSHERAEFVIGPSGIVDI